MLFFSELSGFGQLQPSSASSGGTTSGVPKSDYIKQLQCLIAYAMNAPDSNKAWQSSKELWDNAVAYDKAGGIPVTGAYKTSWPTENDAIWMLSRSGASEFAVFTSAGLAPVDSNLTGYISSLLAYLQRQGNHYGYWPDVAGCNFPGRTQAQLDAIAAQAAAIAAAEQKALAEEQARKEAEAVAIAAAKVAADAAAAAQAQAAAEAAIAAKIAADKAQTQAAADAAAQAAAAAAAASAGQQQEQPSAGARAEVTSTGTSTTTTAVTPPPGFFMSLTRKQKIGAGVGVGLLIALAAAAATRRRRA